MKNIFNFQMDWMVQSSELFAEFIKKGADSYIHDTRVLRIKNDTYFAIFNLWNQLMVIDQRKNSEIKIEHDLERAFSNFNADIKEVYQKMVVGKDYYSRGGWESFIDLLTKEIHRMAGNFNARMKDVHKELDKFWNSFFSIVKADNESVSAFAPVVNELETNLRKIFVEKEGSQSSEKKESKSTSEKKNN